MENKKEVASCFRIGYVIGCARVLLRPSGEPEPEITRLAEFTRYQSSLQGKATAYVCLNFRCRLPTTEVSQMLKSLNTGP